MDKVILKQIFKWVERFHWGFIQLVWPPHTNTHGPQQATYLCQLSQYQQKKHCCHNAHTADFLPPSATCIAFSAIENEPVLFKQPICFRPFCSSRAMKRHHLMGKSSLEQLTSRSFRGRTNPKGYVTKEFFKSSLGISDIIYRKKHVKKLVVHLFGANV